MGYEALRYYEYIHFITAILLKIGLLGFKQMLQ